MGKYNAEWQRKTIATAPGVKTTLTRSRITAQEYQQKKSSLDVTRTRGFGTKTLSNMNFAFSATLRRRNARAKRQDLAKLGTMNPASTERGHKSHFVPDVFGGPNHASNLSHETSKMNLSAHKTIENAMGREMNPNKTTGSPLQRRGSLVGIAQFDANQNSIRREYYLHADDGPGGGDTYMKFTQTTKR